MSLICQHESCLLAALKGIFHGLYYGGKIRFTHSLVMSILFNRQNPKETIKFLLTMTYTHAKAVGGFVGLFKILLCFFNKAAGKNLKGNWFVSGLIAAFFVYKEENSVHSQLFLYLIGRISTGSLNNLMRKDLIPEFKYYRVGIALAFAGSMYLFETDRTVLQDSLVASMKFLYKDSDRKYDEFSDLIPLELPKLVDNLLIL